MKVCFFGAASDRIDKKYIMAAEQLGVRLVEDGHDLIFGAGGTGLMGAVARAVKLKGGHLHGIVPAFFETDGFDKPFSDLDEISVTEDVEVRKKDMVEQSDAFVVLPGGIGTLEELFEVISLKLFERHNKAVIIYNIDGYYDKLEEFIKSAQESGFINVERTELYAIAQTVDEVMRLLQSAPHNPELHRKKN